MGLNENLNLNLPVWFIDPDFVFEAMFMVHIYNLINWFNIFWSGIKRIFLLAYVYTEGQSYETISP